MPIWRTRCYASPPAIRGGELLLRIPPGLPLERCSAVIDSTEFDALWRDRTVWTAAPRQVDGVTTRTANEFVAKRLGVVWSSQSKRILARFCVDSFGPGSTHGWSGCG